MDWEEIKELSLNEPKGLLEKMLKLQEECGELAQEVLINNKSSGLQYKNAVEHGIANECVDILLVTYSIFYSQGYDEDDLSSLMKEKLAKWKKYQKRNK